MQPSRKAVTDTSAGIQAEEQALISGLQNVPKAERHFREPSTERMYEDWRLRLAAEPLEQFRAKLETGCEQ